MLRSLSLPLVLAACAPLEPVFVDLPQERLFPEGILNDGTDTLWVTGFGDGSLLRIDEDDTVSVVKEPGEDGLSSAVGLAADLERGRLWIANFSFDTFASDLKVFDLDSGDLIATVTPDAELGPHFFNEMAIDEDGRVYVSDTLQPRIWTAGPALDEVTVLVEDARLANPAEDRPFGLNGLALTPDGDGLVTSVMDRITQGGGRLVHIALDGLAVTDVALSGDLATFGGSDGMFFDGDQLVMVNVTPPAGLVTAEFDAEFAAAVLTNRPGADDVLNRPTSSALRGRRLFVVNSQLDHLIDDENGAVGTYPDLPFQIVGVDAAEVLASE
ncbi:MAG: hypothetical protein AAF211_03655 [Myxococcota bacterium]